MPHIDHEQACKILLRILPNMDTKQVEEVLSLTNKSSIETQRFIDLIWISELLWSSRKDNFEFIAGCQCIGWCSHNVWILSTGGIQANIRFFLRELKKARDYAIRSFNYEPQTIYATMPIWFDDGHKLAEHFGFVIDSKTSTTVQYMGTFEVGINKGMRT